MEKVKTIDEYISLCPEEYQNRLFELREFIYNLIPNVEERMSWGMPTFYFKENVIHFALAKHHIGIYPGAEAVEFFADKLKKYKTSKGAIQIPLSMEIPYPLIQEIVEHRLKEINK